MEYNITYGSKVGNPIVVTLAMAKRNSNIDFSELQNDELLQVLLDASVQDAENYMDTTILERNITITYTGWSTKWELPVYPVKTLTSITYLDANGDTQTVSPSDYMFFESNRCNKVRFTWDTAPELQEVDFPITVTLVAGYASEDVPASIKSAVLMRFSHKEAFREDIPTSYNRSFQAALRPFKRW